MKKRLSMLLPALLICASLLASCSSATPQTSVSVQSPITETATVQPSATPGLPAVGDFTEKVKISWLVAWDDQTKYNPDNPITKELNQRFNIDISTPIINASEEDKLATFFASGDIPDVIVRWSPIDYYNQGIIQALDKEMMATYMPQSYAVFDNAIAWKSVTSVSDGKIVAMPIIWLMEDVATPMAIRSDWLNKVNANVPKTIDELTEVMRKFTEEDPDGNGKKDTYGLTFAGLTQTNFLVPAVFGAYGVIPFAWLKDDSGAVVNCAVADGYKQGLKLLASWYSAGYINPEWVTNDNAAYYNEIESGKVGIWNWVPPTYFNTVNPNGFYGLTKAQNPNAEWQIFAPPVGPTGKSGGLSGAPEGVSYWGTMIGAKTPISTVTRIMQVCEAMNVDKDLFTLTFMGVKDTHYQVLDGVNTLLDDVSAAPAAYGVRCFRTGSYLFDYIYSAYVAPSVVEAYNLEKTFPAYINSVAGDQLNSYFTIEQAASIDTAEMTRMRDEFFVNAVTGKLDIDAEWDAYVQKWLNLGGKLQTDAANEIVKMDN